MVDKPPVASNTRMLAGLSTRTAKMQSSAANETDVVDEGS